LGKEETVRKILRMTTRSKGADKRRGGLERGALPLTCPKDVPAASTPGRNDIGSLAVVP
jgi:hypothetical protein